MMKVRSGACLAGCLALALCGPLAAQENRAALIERARNEFDIAARIRLFASAMDPRGGPPDSLWAVAGYDLAWTLLDQGSEQLAGVLFRHIARHAGRWPADPGYYPASVTSAADAGRRAVEAAPDQGSEALVREDWVWPATFDPSRPGALQLAAAPQAPGLQIRVEDGAAIPSDQSLTLPTGTHTIVVEGEGFETARITRDVLPGVTTILAFEPVPALAAAVRQNAIARLVRVGRGAACVNGFRFGGEDLVATSLRGVSPGGTVPVAPVDGDYANATVVAIDATRGLALLRSAAGASQPLAATADVRTGQDAWAVHFMDCEQATVTRTSVTAWNGITPARIDPIAREDATGGPLIDGAGRLLGIVVAPDTVLPAAALDELLRRAREPVVAAVVAPQGRRGFPWKWVAAGVGAVGVTAALLGGGGGGGGGGGRTGGITITFPN